MKRYFQPMPEPVPASLGLLVLRLAFGGMLLTHGWPKLQMILNGQAASFPDPLGIGPETALYLSTFAEFGCAILVMAGLLTRLATIPLIINFLVAALVVHAGQPFENMEKALMYGSAFAGLLFAGPGLYSLDALWAGDKVSEAPKRRTHTTHAAGKETVVREVHQNREEDGQYTEGHHATTRKERTASAGPEAAPTKEPKARRTPPTASKKTEESEKKPRSGGGSRRKQSS